ncbi:TRAP transporter membrane protein [Streptomyces sp. NBRC 110611]|uniref:hypothetical protein n=1 Tax=Streptomyces sp. NBRC 110611 TaxID=1621259 RepID=UPI0008584809|nr:hypothetical protein [Streptomyces sp. NBRC 110611]GAU71660.1 TRAP transporter membrane protein [Streptomyces sp. NBRC 110611]
MPWQSRLAWQVTVFMGLRSLAFYTAVAWLPSILIDRRTSSTTAGWMLFFYQVASQAASSLLPLLTRDRHDQRWTLVGASALLAGGLTVLVAAPALSVLACTLHDVTRSWTLLLAVLAVLGIVMALAGHGEGRDRHLRQPSYRSDRSVRTATLPA